MIYIYWRSLNYYSPSQMDEPHRHNQNLVETLHNENRNFPTVVEGHGNCCK
ncbi:MAG: hypothetical protein O4808_14750 [Trichodesmium sp. St17_bin3_1_1]|nr:hypothetical protein [Trichodesmium sp. St17_bin3_1_1]